MALPLILYRKKPVTLPVPGSSASMYSQIDRQHKIVVNKLPWSKTLIPGHGVS